MTVSVASSWAEIITGSRSGERVVPAPGGPLPVPDVLFPGLEWVDVLVAEVFSAKIVRRSCSGSSRIALTFDTVYAPARVGPRRKCPRT